MPTWNMNSGTKLITLDVHVQGHTKMRLSKFDINIASCVIWSRVESLESVSPYLAQTNAMLLYMNKELWHLPNLQEGQDN